ncbi:restriction endonuclease subunit S [Thiothrix litoralis]|uniref:Restriction endonuclease subunit S n=1 Tax=Thiothrix litoralis TaxID=2891210 RepID=A0ABX7WZ73_9GAMM|nr:restriction endonuclease subunit S [Thiothrix litoralis]QTR47688.1 restriction endonuclease subunit S [Thiothrix litoralis]
MSNTQLPNGWLEVPLGKYTINKDGKRLPISATQRENRKGSIPYYGATGKIDSLDDFTHEGENILVGEDGANLISRNKNIAFIVNGKYWVNNHAHVICCYSGIPNSYLFYYLNSLVLDEWITGSAQPKLTKSNLEAIPVKVPPLAEQKEIATLLDNLLAQVDTLKTRLDAIPNILKRFRQSVLAAAVSGKLTEEWRTENTKHEWEYKTIGDVCAVATGKTPSRSESSYWDNGTVPWLTSAATGDAFTVYAKEYITALAVSECQLKKFEPGTLLLAMYGEGKTRGQVTELKLSATCNQACAAITVNESIINRKFVKIRLQENYEETRKAAAGGNQPNLNLSKVREIPIPLPPIEEQEEIVRRVEELFAFADQIEQRVKVAQQRVNHLTQAILAKAFRGELTAEWREQNPDLISGENSAVALLARIQASNSNNVKASRHSK